MAPPKGSWEGSVVTDDDIAYLRRTRRLPGAEEVEARVPGEETVPEPREDEVVVFYSHFIRGFGLPASNFLRRFLGFFGLQPHHLGANAILQIAAFATLCEGYIGLLPYTELWCRLFYLKQQGATPGVMSACGAAVVVARPAGSFPRLPLEDSAKKWQRSFFYVKNVDPAADCINLPPFNNVPPAERLNWGHNPRTPSEEILGVCSRIKEMIDLEGLNPVDLIAAFVARRVLPLRRRPHRICDMSGRRDPSRMSTKELSPAGVARRVNSITNAGLDEATWGFGKEPYSRLNPAPVVSPWSLFFATSCLFLRPDALGRLQKFPSQQVLEGPAPPDLQPDLADSDGEEAGSDEEEGGGGAHLEDAGAGGPSQAGKSPTPDPLREWTDDDEDALSGAHDAVRPTVGTDAGIAPRRRPQRTAEAGASGESADAGRPHGKQPVEPRPVAKRPAAAHPAGGKTAVRKKRRLAQSAGPKRAVPTAIG